jgi:hypothetical protein
MPGNGQPIKTPRFGFSYSYPVDMFVPTEGERPSFLLFWFEAGWR